MHSSRIRRRALRRALSGLLVFLALSWTACAPPEEMLKTLPSPVPTEQIADAAANDASPTNNAPEATAGAETGAETGAKTPAAPQTLEQAVDVGRVVPQLKRASRSLQSNFKDFLTREDLGIDARLPTLATDDARTFGREARAAYERLDDTGPLRFILTMLPLLIVCGFVGVFALVDRRMINVSMWWQASQHSDLSGWATSLLRSGAMITGQLIAPVLMVALSYFPVRAIYPDAIWPRLLSNAIWLILAWRIARWAVESLYGLRLAQVTDEHANTLRRFALRVVRITLAFLMAMDIARAFGLHPQLQAALFFCLKLSFALMSAYALRLREELMSLLPAESDSSFYLSLRRLLDRNFRALSLLTLLLLTLRAFGYVKAATFLLIRGYGIFALLVFAFLGMAKVSRVIKARGDALEFSDPQRELLSSIRRLLSIGTFVLALTTALELVGLYTPLKILLKIPFITVQSVEFSIFNILSAALIVGVAALVSQVIRAVLNARVYPSFGVEVGVAYAVNTIINYAVIIVGFFLVLIALGVNLGALTVVLASLSVGIGFGLQTITENMISGFIILFGRAVRKGDYVTVGDVYGRVEAVGARLVVVRTTDNYDMLIPSKELVGGKIINWTYRDTLVRMHVGVGVSYDADPRKVQELLLEAAGRHAHVLKTPKPEVWFVNFGDSSIDFELLVYYDCRVTNADRLRGTLYYHIWDVLAEHDVEIPFPQRDLHVRTSPGFEDLAKALAAHPRRDVAVDGGEEAPGD
jgi:small-conductance mechanosensitive channel